MANDMRGARAVVLGHPVHPMLIVFPVGLFVTAVVFDAIDMFGGSPVFGLVAYWMLAAGLVGAVLAAVFGLGVHADANPDAPSSLGGRSAGRTGHGRQAHA